MAGIISNFYAILQNYICIKI